MVTMLCCVVVAAFFVVQFDISVLIACVLNYKFIHVSSLVFGSDPSKQSTFGSFPMQISPFFASYPEQNSKNDTVSFPSMQ